LQKDEIVGITTGNIKKYIEISKAVINGKYCVTLNVLVTPEKLASFVKSQGMVVEYQGESFASNIKIQMMNEKSEEQAIRTLSDYAKIVYSHCFDYDLKAKDPYMIWTNEWEIKMELSVKANKNFDNLNNHIIKTLGSITLKSKDLETRKKMGKYPHVIVFNENKFILRENESRTVLWKLFDDDLLKSIGSVRILMDAGSYSRDIPFADKKNYSGFKFLNDDDGFGKFIKLTNYPPLDERVFTFISVERNKYGGIFAKFSYNLLMKGKNSVDVISNIKGFKVLK